MPKQMYYTQEVIHVCELFGKPFAFLKDVDGHIYGVPMKPVYEGVSVDGQTGDEVPIQTGWEPDLTR